MKNQETITRLTNELKSWTEFFERNKSAFASAVFATNRDRRWGEIALNDIEKVVVGKQNRLNEYLNSNDKPTV